MPSYQKCYYCKDCKTNVTVDEKGHCKRCGGSSLNITWSARFRIVDVTGEKQKRLTGFETKKKAEAAYVDFMSNYSPLQSAQKREFIFEDCLNDYFRTYQLENAESTIYDKKQIFETFITPTFKGRDIQTISKQELQGWQNNLWNYVSEKTKTRLSWKYLTKIRGFFNNFLEFCQTMYDIPNKLSNIRIPRNTELKKQIKFWEIDTFNSFIETVDDIMWKTLWNVFMFTGARFNEIRALSDDDIKDGKITISKTLLKKGKNGGITKPTKNYKIVTKQIPSNLTTQINEYKKWKKANDISSKFLFGGDHPLSENYIRRALKLHIKNAKVEYITPHGFRHSYVSLLINLGISTKIIAELIGDTEIQVIKTYGHLYQNAKDDAINMLDLALKKA